MSNANALQTNENINTTTNCFNILIIDFVCVFFKIQLKEKRLKLIEITKKKLVKSEKLGRTENFFLVDEKSHETEEREKNQVILTIDEQAMNFDSRDMYDYVTIYGFEMLTNALPDANEIIVRKTLNSNDS